MNAYTAVIERDKTTGLYVGYVPGLAGAHSQGATIDELRENLTEVIEMLREDEMFLPDAEFIGTHLIEVA